MRAYHRMLSELSFEWRFGNVMIQLERKQNFCWFAADLCARTRVRVHYSWMIRERERERKRERDCLVRVESNLRIWSVTRRIAKKGDFPRDTIRRNITRRTRSEASCGALHADGKTGRRRKTFPFNNFDLLAGYRLGKTWNGERYSALRQARYTHAHTHRHTYEAA